MWIALTEPCPSFSDASFLDGIVLLCPRCLQQEQLSKYRIFPSAQVASVWGHVIVTHVGSEWVDDPKQPLKLQGDDRSVKCWRKKGTESSCEYLGKWEQSDKEEKGDFSWRLCPKRLMSSWAKCLLNCSYLHLPGVGVGVMVLFSWPPVDSWAIKEYSEKRNGPSSAHS